MKILAIETSSEAGSVALVQAIGPFDLRVMGYARHDAYNEHAERLPGLLEEAFEQAGWKKSDVDRIAVGVGPGSFTGVRVGLSVAQGLMLGLNVPGVGVGSLRALSAAMPADDPRVRIVVRDARRDEYFIAVYSADSQELSAPVAVAQDQTADYLRDLIAENSTWMSPVVLGTKIDGFPFAAGDDVLTPDARGVARLACTLVPSSHPIEPCYLRGPNLIRPILPQSPLDMPRVERQDP